MLLGAACGSFLSKDATVGAPGWLGRLGVRLQLAVRGFEPRVGLCADSSEPGACFRFWVSLSLCPSPTHALSLSVPKINKRFLKKKKDATVSRTAAPWPRVLPAPAAVATLRPGRPDGCAVWSPRSAPRWPCGSLQGDAPSRPRWVAVSYRWVSAFLPFVGRVAGKFSPVCRLSFRFLHGGGWRTNVFNFQEFQVIQFPFYGSCFGYLISEQFPCSLEIPGSSPVCVSGSFSLLCLRGSL